MTWVDNDSTDGEMMLVGGVADSFSCGALAVWVTRLAPDSRSIIDLFVPCRGYPLPSHVHFLARFHSESPFFPNRF